MRSRAESGCGEGTLAPSVAAEACGAGGTASAGLLFSLIVLSACGPPGPPPVDAGADTGTIDAAEAGEDVLDATPPDGPLSDVVDDVSPEGDVTIDGGEADASPDVAPDAQEDALVDTGADAPYPPVCGDGWRDPDTEECDDGLDSSVPEEDRACTGACTVTDHPIALDPIVQERRLGFGRHPAAAGPHGGAGAFVEVLSPSAGGYVRVGVALFSPVGQRLSTAFVSGTLYDADPVLAALPNGSFALAFNSLDVDGDGLGIALTIVEADGTLGTVTHANETLLFGQHSPDIIWTGSELVVGWEDESPAGARRLCTRRFSESLVPLSQESCFPNNGWFRSHLVLAPFDGNVVQAWREEQGGVSYAVLSGLGPTQNLDLGGLPASWEAPAVAAMDSDHVLLVHTSADDSLLGIVVDATGNPVWGPAPLFAAPVAPRYSPALVVTGDGIYLAWQEPPPPPDPVSGWDPQYEETWIQKLLWDGQTLDTEELPIPLPRYTWHRPGDQTMPALAATPLYPLGAIFAAWNDLTSDNYPVEAPHGDVAFSLIPTPILRQPLGH